MQDAKLVFGFLFLDFRKEKSGGEK